MSETSLYDALPFVCTDGHTKDVPTRGMSEADIEKAMLGGVMQCNVLHCKAELRLDRRELVRRLHSGQPNP